MADNFEESKNEEWKKKLGDLKDKAFFYGRGMWNYAMEHKKEAAGIALGFASGVKWLNRQHTKKEEERWRNRSFYDRSTGQYYMTKKDVTQAQHLQIEARRRNGEPLGQILASMRLL